MVLRSASAGQAGFERWGSLEAWQEHVAALVASHPRAVFAISVALAGPLLGVVEAAGGGFNFFGGSSRGKTTLLGAGGSVWGGSAFLRSWRATDNGVEGVAALHSGTVLPIDELGQITGKAAREIAYMLANGTGKTRACRGGEARAPAVWRLMIMSTGEVTLAEKIAEESGRRPKAGQAVRIIDIPADQGAGFGVFGPLEVGEGETPMSVGQQFADRLKRAAAENYGHAGPAFVEEIIGQGIVLAELVREWSDEWVAEHVEADAAPQVRRAAARFALVAAAGELAIRFKIVPWATGTANEAAARLFRDYLAARGGIEPSEITEGIKTVRKFIEQHPSRFEDNGSGKDVINRAGFKIKVKGEELYCLLPEVFRTEVLRGLPVHDIAQALLHRGILAPGEMANGSRKLQKQIRVGDHLMRLYAIRLQIFEGAQDEDLGGAADA